VVDHVPVGRVHRGGGDRVVAVLVGLGRGAEDLLDEQAQDLEGVDLARRE